MEETSPQRTAGAGGRPEAARAVWDWQAGPGGGDAHPGRRRGGIQALTGAAVGAAVFVFWHRPVAYAVWAVSAIVLALALAAPSLHTRLDRLLQRFGHAVGRGLTVLLLAPLFYLFFVPFGRLLRRGRRDRLARRFDRGARSYWKPRREGERTLVDFERHF